MTGELTPSRTRPELLAGLDETQRAAVTTDAAPLCVVAGPGSGKTTVLTRRVARRLHDGSALADHTFVFTFTRKAATEVRGRLAGLRVDGEVWAGTFHAAAFSRLRRHWLDTDRPAPGVTSDPSRILRGVLPGVVSVRPEIAGAPAAVERLVSVLGTEIHWAKARLVSPEEYEGAQAAEGRHSSIPPQLVAAAYEAYENEKSRRGLLDLDDLVDRCATLLEQDHRAAASERWRVRHVFVDEFQDVNPAQWRLLRAWIAGRDDVFVVGDPRQAVYGWNGADPTLLGRLGELLPGTTVLELASNHRSTPQIVATSGALLANEEVTGRTRRQAAPRATAATRDEGTAPVISGFGTDEDEAAEVSRWLRRAHRPGRSWSQLAVLARTNSRLDVIARTLKSRGIPVEVRPAVGATRAPAGRDDLDVALRLLKAMPARRPLRSAMADLVSEIGQRGEDRERATGESEVPEPSPGGLPEALWRLVDEHCAEVPEPSTGEFVSWVAATGASVDDRTRRDAVALCTFHGCKGLQWKAVAVTGLESGLVPVSYATSDAALAEERRLLYVALTRAEDELWCSWAAQRTSGYRPGPCRPSPFLCAIEGALDETAPAEAPAASRTRVAELRTALLRAG